MLENSFADMLRPDEVLLAQLAGEGRPIERNGTMERTWYHVGLTPERLLVIGMRQPNGANQWTVFSRLGTSRGYVRLSHYPRTKEDGARFAVDGCGDRIVFVNVDEPPMLPQIRPFVDAWGGPVAGAEAIAAPREELESAPQDDRKMLLWAGGAILAMMVLCCGAAGLMVALRVLFGLLG